MRKLLLFCLILNLFSCLGNDDTSATDASPDVFKSDVVIRQNYDAISTDLDGGLAPGSFDLRQPQAGEMKYYGGSVLISPINIYFIWYGSWTDTKVAPILEDLIKGVGDSAWWQINSSYYQQKFLPTPIIDAGLDGDAEVNDASVLAPRLYVTNVVNFVRSVYVGYPHGTQLRNSDVVSIVSDAIASNQVPPDTNGVYFVLTSADVTQRNRMSGFCSDYCGWHQNNQISGLDIRLAFVGDVEACPNSCSLHPEYVDAGFNNSPNGNWSADGMASVIMHELSETATDPDAFTAVAWIDINGAETMDKCAWVFGILYKTMDGSVANVPIGNRDFMIQQNWAMDNDGGHCDLHP